MVPDKFNMVDMGGIDLIMMQGEAVPGLYDKLMAAISNCRYQCLYNWLFDGVLISPTYVQLTDIDGEVYLNEGVSVTSDDVIHIYSVEPAPVDPEIVPLLAEENGVYTVSAGVDGYNPVTVDVPAPAPVIAPITIEENGVYPITGSIDGYGPITVNVSGGDVPEPSLPAAYQEVEYIDFDGNSFVTIGSEYLSGNFCIETFATYTDGNTSEQCFIGVTNPGNTARFELFFSGGNSRVFTSSLQLIFSCIDNTFYWPSQTSSQSTSAGTKKYFMMSVFDFSNVSKYLQIGAYGGSYRFRSRLYKIRKSEIIMASGDEATGSFGNYSFANPVYYKPCYRKADNVPGWYDTTNDVFYTNEGTGTFVVGPDVN